MSFKSLCSIGLVALTSFNFFAQNNDEVLLVVNNDSIKTSEFLKVYNKNLDLVKDVSQKELDTYLDLFVDYQLKLNEARRLKLDEDKKYLREYENYKKQLTKNYVTESEVTEELVQEAYDRMKEDIHAVHVLVKLSAVEEDTLAAYNKVLQLRERLISEDFDSIRADIHNGKTVFAEDLGYFSAFKMVYDFESEAYNTPMGSVSMPFRTQFGYHAVKVLDRRPSRGTITAAHIMIANEQKDTAINPELRIKNIYTRLKNGDPFESLAKQFSDDKSSAKNGGELTPFKSGQLSSVEFENMAFSLNADGDISEPFQTRFGWHIIKRIKLEPLGEFEELKPQLENQVKRDSRSKLIKSAMVKSLEERYEIIKNPEATAYFISILNDDFFSASWNLPKEFDSKKIVFTIDGKTYDYKNFGIYLVSQQRNYLNNKVPFDFLVNSTLDRYYENSILEYREENLENENPEFASVLKEYRDGLLLFELMEREIWNKASRDSVGLQAYYQAHKENYRWEDRVDVIIASASNKKSLKSIDRKKFNLENIEDLKSELQLNQANDVIFTTGVFEKSSSNLPENLTLKTGDVDVYEHNNSFHLIKINEFIPSEIKSFEESRGQVTNDYQIELEKKWVDELKERYPVIIYKEVFNQLKAKN